jgi:fatty acid desaturase
VGNILRLPDSVATALSVARHAAGRMTVDEITFIPESERPAVYREARVWVAIYALIIGAAIYLGSWLPLMYVGLPSLYGYWLVYLFGIAQHAGLAENVLDHRLNSRTIYMNPVLRFLFSNMNYHVEHHMFPMVPYHALPALHEEVRFDMPTAYPSFLAAYREIIPTLWRQTRHPEYFARRELPPTAQPFRPELHDVVFET